MKRLIIVSFAFMGFAFYHLSGGEDFQPRRIAIAKVAVIETTVEPNVLKKDKVQAASLVASPAVQPAAKATVTSTPVAFITPNTIPTPPPAAAPAINPIAQPLVLASLEQGLVGLTTATPSQPTPEPAVFTAPLADVREITATRVNMRDGPGTTYPVLARLGLGHEVEVLDNPGNGWLRLRTLPEERVGWISASLVSKANR